MLTQRKHNVIPTNDSCDRRKRKDTPEVSSGTLYIVELSFPKVRLTQD
mgnify:CR=1 FL=1